MCFTVLSLFLFLTILITHWNKVAEIHEENETKQRVCACVCVLGIYIRTHPKYKIKTSSNNGSVL